MPPEPLTAPPSSHYCRTPEGLWIRAERVPNAVRVYYQARTVVADGCLVELDAQGEEAARQPLVGAEYPPEWRLAGEIPATGAIIDVAGLQDFDWFQFGVMRHAAELIRLGYGDTPADVLSWFADVREGAWVRRGVYEVVGPERDPFRGLGIARIEIDDRWPAENGDPPAEDRRVLSGRAVVQEGNAFPFEFPLDEVLAAFTIATVPR